MKESMFSSGNKSISFLFMYTITVRVSSLVEMKNAVCYVYLNILSQFLFSRVFSEQNLQKERMPERILQVKEVFEVK